MMTVAIRTILITFVAIQIVCAAEEIKHRSKRVVKGVPARIADFRGQVSLQKYDGHFCGGVLIDRTHVLTAAHCVWNKQNFYVVGGDAYVSDIEPSSKRQSRHVSNFTIYPGYSLSWGIKKNDIAIIRVSDPFEITDVVQPMKLSRSTPKANTSCTIVGWGNINKCSGSDCWINRETEHLLKTELHTINLEECRKKHDRYSSYVTDMHMCAMNGGSSACHGDSGGLLTCSEGEVSGIVAFSDGCGMGYPGVYMDVSKYEDWIISLVPSLKRSNSDTQSSIDTNSVKDESSEGDWYKIFIIVRKPM